MRYCRSVPATTTSRVEGSRCVRPDSAGRGGAEAGLRGGLLSLMVAAQRTIGGDGGVSNSLAHRRYRAAAALRSPAHLASQLEGVVRRPVDAFPPAYLQSGLEV